MRFVLFLVYKQLPTFITFQHFSNAVGICFECVFNEYEIKNVLQLIYIFITSTDEKMRSFAEIWFLTFEEEEINIEYFDYTNTVYRKDIYEYCMILKLK